MKSAALRVALLLLLVTGTVTAEGSDLSEAHHGDDLHPEAAAQRPKRFGERMMDFFGRKGGPANPTPAVGDGLNLADALHPVPIHHKHKPAGGLDKGFNLEDALRPAETTDPSGGNCQRILIEKLNEVLANQKLLLKPKAPSSRFYNGR